MKSTDLKRIKIAKKYLNPASLKILNTPYDCISKTE